MMFILLFDSQSMRMGQPTLAMILFDCHSNGVALRMMFIFLFDSQSMHMGQPTLDVIWFDSHNNGVAL